MAKQKSKTKRNFLEAYDELCQAMSRRGQKDIMSELEKYRTAWKKLRDALEKKRPSIDEVIKLWKVLEGSGIQSIDKLTEILDSTGSVKSISDRIPSSTLSSSKDKLGSSSSGSSSESESESSASSCIQAKKVASKAVTAPTNKAQSPVSAKATSKKGPSSSSIPQSESESESDSETGTESESSDSEMDVDQSGPGSKSKAAAKREAIVSPTKESKAESISATLRTKKHSSSSSSDSCSDSEADSDDSEADAKAVSAVVRTVLNPAANLPSVVSSGPKTAKSKSSVSASEPDLGSSSATGTTNEGFAESRPIRLPSNAVSKPKSSSASSDSSNINSDSSSESESDKEKEREEANVKRLSKQKSGSSADSESESESNSSSESDSKEAPPAKRQKIGYGNAAATVAANVGSRKKEDTPSTIDGLPQSSSSSVTPLPITTTPATTSGGSNGNGKEKRQPQKNNTPFQRIKADIVTFADERLKDNSFTARGAKSGDYGERAHKELIVTRGAGFRKEKNKKKRGSYRGGEITLESHSIKFT